MVNLIMNSLTHAFDEGQKGLIRIAAEADENRVRLVFSDDGRGMDKNVSERMFRSLFHHPTRTGRKRAGPAYRLQPGYQGSRRNDRGLHGTRRWREIHP